jgi:Berberine and berberine like
VYVRRRDEDPLAEEMPMKYILQIYSGRATDEFERLPEAEQKRLTELKQRYDRTNLFHLNQNIPPA